MKGESDEESGGTATRSRSRTRSRSGSRSDTGPHKMRKAPSTSTRCSAVGLQDAQALTKAQRNRLAQRAFRQREAQQVAGLEGAVSALRQKVGDAVAALQTRIADLAATKAALEVRRRRNAHLQSLATRVAPISLPASASFPAVTSSASFSALPTKHLLFCGDCVKHCELILSTLSTSSKQQQQQQQEQQRQQEQQQEPQQQPISIDYSNTAVSADIDGSKPIALGSAASIYGLPHIPPASIAALTSLKSLDQSRHADPSEIQQKYVHLIAARRALLDACSVLDRRAAIEILEADKDLNRRHWDHMYKQLNSINPVDRIAIQQSSYSSTLSESLSIVKNNQLNHRIGVAGDRAGSSLDSQLKSMVNALLRIDSLRNNHVLVNELSSRVYVEYMRNE
ncbi:hypothetical protein HK100_011260 [Physocladia obscura]|uniref:BZIP domain-containing protein n=1 Tax=Physocladia obscura TaxID=109957 RepID=A0AAD5T1E4_9FUNG|nr:hypothetical protein HK100_011260 [Physocladia obscura]